MSLWPVWTRVVIFARTAQVDPAFDDLKKRIKQKLESKGIDPEDPEEEYCFESLEHLPRVLQRQTELIKEERSLGRKKLSQLCILLHEIQGQHTSR